MNQLLGLEERRADGATNDTKRDSRDTNVEGVFRKLTESILERLVNQYEHERPRIERAEKTIDDTRRKIGFALRESAAGRFEVAEQALREVLSNSAEQVQRGIPRFDCALHTCDSVRPFSRRILCSCKSVEACRRRTVTGSSSKT